MSDSEEIADRVMSCCSGEKDELRARIANAREALICVAAQSKDGSIGQAILLEIIEGLGDE